MTFALKKNAFTFLKFHLCFSWLAAEKRNLLSSLASIFLKSSSSARKCVNRQASTPILAGNPRSCCSTWQRSVETKRMALLPSYKVCAAYTPTPRDRRCTPRNLGKQKKDCPNLPSLH